MAYKIAINTMALTEKLPDGDHRWGPFNDGFDNQELEVLDFANDIYMGRSYAAWHRGRRCVDNFLCAQHIGVDMDTEDKRSTIDYIRQIEFVKVYGGLVHTTTSHTLRAPRARILFFLDQPITNAESYKTAIGFIYSLFSDPDASCVDCSRFFYGSKDCQIELMENVLPLMHLRSYYHRWQHTQSKQPAKPASQVPQRTFTPKTTEEKDIADALKKIDPWGMDYNKWIAILAALHDELGSAGLPLAVAWAQGTPGEVEKKWKTFGRYSGRKATLASVFGLAKTH